MTRLQNPLVVLTFAAMTFTAVAIANDAQSTGDAPIPTGLESCPLTIPPGGFVPPEGYPTHPPGEYRAEWFGTPDLWTMLAPEGQVWADLPYDKGTFGQKSFWWSEGYSWVDTPMPSIAVAGHQVDGMGAFETGGTGTNGMREDIGSFMLVGIEIPEAGCWELTATYMEAQLTLVVWVED